MRSSFEFLERCRASTVCTVLQKHRDGLVIRSHCRPVCFAFSLYILRHIEGTCLENASPSHCSHARRVLQSPQAAWALHNPSTYAGWVRSGLDDVPFRVSFVRHVVHVLRPSEVAGDWFSIVAPVGTIASTRRRPAFASSRPTLAALPHFRHSGRFGANHPSWCGRP
jgi:hypothetical protein